MNKKQKKNLQRIIIALILVLILKLLPLLFTIMVISSNTFSEYWTVVGKFFLNCLHLCSKFNFLSIVIAKFMMKNCQGKLIALLPLGIRQN